MSGGSLPRQPGFAFAWKTMGAVALLNVTVAFAAFLKDLWLAKYLGTSAEADALAFAYFIPDAVGNNLFAAALGVACVPVLSRAAMADPGEGFDRAVASVMRAAAGWALGLCLLVALAAPWLASVPSGAAGRFAPGDLTAVLLWLLCPSILLFPLLTLGTAALQAKGKFRWAAAAPLWFNVVFLLAVGASDLLRLEPGAGAAAIAVGITAAVAAGAWSVGKPLARAVRAGAASAERAPLGRWILPYLAVLLCAQAVYFAERWLAGMTGPGAISGLSYAFRLAQFPIWTLIAAVTAVILPELAAEGREGEARRRSTLSKAMSVGWACALPIAALLHLLAEPIAAALFQRGAFDARSLAITVSILKGYALSIPGQALFLVGLRYFLAKGSLRETVGIAFASGALTVAFDLALLPRLGLAAIGYGAAAGAAAQAVGMLLLLVLKHRALGRPWLAGAGLALAANVPPALLLERALRLPYVAEALSGGWSRYAALASFAVAYIALGFAIYYLIQTITRKKGTS